MRQVFRSHRGRSKKLATAWLFTATGGWRAGEYQCGICKEKKLYERRNCQKHFPELVQINRKPFWRPKFPIAGGKESFSVEAYRSAECPVSMITGESIQIVEQIHTAESLQKTGAALYGPDGSKYPAWWTDAIAAIQSARNAVEEALEKKRASN